MTSRRTPAGEGSLLALGLLVFLGLARFAAGGTGPHAPSRARLMPGGVRVEATLEKTRVLQEKGEEVLVHLRLRGAESAERRPIDLALVLDVSGGGSLASALADAALGVSHGLGEDDRVTVIAFSGTAQTVLRLDGTPGDALAAGRTSNPAVGLEAAARELRRAGRPDAVPRIVLVTGAGPSVDRAALLENVAALADAGIATSTLGLGVGIDAAFLAALAESGGGTFHRAGSLESVAEVTRAELQDARTLVARDVQVELEPSAGVELLGVVAWATRVEDGRLRVRVGDFAASRSTKVVARLRVTDPSRLGASLVAVAVSGRDARGARHGASGELGAQLTREPSSVLAYADAEVRHDLEDAALAGHLRRAQDAARRGDAARARRELAGVRRLRPVLETAGERWTVDELERDLLAGLPATAPESGALGAMRTIGTSESVFREGDKESDNNLDDGMLTELADQRLVDSVLGARGPSASTGDRYFTTNQAGVIFYTTGKLTLEASRGRAEGFVESLVIPTGK